jgi:hypothetical protein
LKKETTITRKGPEDLTPFQQEILKKEIDLIDQTIERIDKIQLSMKNWTVLIWGGSLFLIVENMDDPRPLVLLTILIPLLFGYLDLLWKRQILIVSYREQRISDFVNGEVEQGGFRVLDPIGLAYQKKKVQPFDQATSLRKAIAYKDAGLFYIVMAVLSFVFFLNV